MGRPGDDEARQEADRRSSLIIEKLQELDQSM